MESYIRVVSCVDKNTKFIVPGWSRLGWTSPQRGKFPDYFLLLLDGHTPNHAGLFKFGVSQLISGIAAAQHYTLLVFSFSSTLETYTGFKRKGKRSTFVAGAISVRSLELETWCCAIAVEANGDRS